MKNQISQPFYNLQNQVQIIYKETLSILKDNEKIDKQQMKQVKKQVNNKINTLEKNVKFFDQHNNNQLTQIFLFESLDVLKELTLSPLWISYLEYVDVKQLVKDKIFLIFLKHNMMIDIVYKFQKENIECFDTQTEYAKNLRTYFGDMRSLVLSYFLIKEKNITKIKIQNISSFVLKGSTINGTSYLYTNKQLVLNQLTTGIKYEKIKESVNNTTNTRPYTKSNKFNILDSVKNTIRIKYLSKQAYKHQFHKSPIEHERQGHYRTYKNGKKVWIQQLTINIGAA